MSSLDPKTPIHLSGNSRTVLTTNITGEYTADKKPKDKWRNSGRARGTGRRGGTRIVNDTTEPVPGAQSISEKPKPSPRPRPTHFLALPLQNHPELRAAVARFQAALFEVTGKDDVGAPGVIPSASPEDRSVSKILPVPATSKTAKAKAKARTKVKLSPTIQGLDTSILIDPRRLHMTLGVMSLEKDEEAASVVGVDVAEDQSVSERLSRLQIKGSSLPSPRTPRTIDTALSLLASLKPRITEILNGSKGVDVPLEVLDVMKTEKIRVQKNEFTRASEVRSSVDPEESGKGELDASKEGNVSSNVDGRPPEESVPGTPKRVEPQVGAGVLFLGPSHVPAQNQDEGRRKLMTICELVQTTFKSAGYLTDTRPLKLHCTIINASHRKPSRRMPFSYSDILQSPAMLTLTEARPIVGFSTDADPSTEVSTVSVSVEAAKPEVSLRSFKVPPPVEVNLGKCHVEEIQLWEMGSHTNNNEYVNCGGIILD